DHPFGLGRRETVPDFAAKIIPALRIAEPGPRPGAVSARDALRSSGGKDGGRLAKSGGERRKAIDRQIRAGHRPLAGPAGSGEGGDVRCKLVDRMFGDMAVARDLPAIDGEERRALVAVKIDAVAAGRCLGFSRPVLDERANA